jgi:hypothetical protein
MSEICQLYISKSCLKGQLCENYHITSSEYRYIMNMRSNGFPDAYTKPCLVDLVVGNCAHSCTYFHLGQDARFRNRQNLPGSKVVRSSEYCNMLKAKNRKLLKQNIVLRKKNLKLEERKIADLKLEERKIADLKLEERKIADLKLEERKIADLKLAVPKKKSNTKRSYTIKCDVLNMNTWRSGNVSPDLEIIENKSRSGTILSALSNIQEEESTEPIIITEDDIDPGNISPV